MPGLLENIKNNKNIISELYGQYGRKLYGYAITKWQVTEDEAWEIVYKTIYRFSEVSSRYTFENESRLQAFIFQSFINNLRNLYQEKKNKQVDFVELEGRSLASIEDDNRGEEVSRNPYMLCLKKILDQFEDWKRILMLMRAQDYAYEEIADYVRKPAEQLKVYYMRTKKILTDRVNECVQAELKTEH